MTNPIATASYDDEHHHHHHHRSLSASQRFSHSPLVAAMISNNRMTNCHDVSAMMAECSAASGTEGSNDQLCRTAAAYMNICFQGNTTRSDGPGC